MVSTFKIIGFFHCSLAPHSIVEIIFYRQVASSNRIDNQVFPFNMIKEKVFHSYKIVVLSFVEKPSRRVHFVGHKHSGKKEGMGGIERPAKWFTLSLH